MSHNTRHHGGFKLSAGKNLRFLDYQLKSQNSGLETNQTKSELFKASRHYFSHNYIKLQRKVEKKIFLLLNESHPLRSKAEHTVKYLRCLALISLTLKALILPDNLQARVNHITNTEHQSEFKNKSNKHFIC